MKRDKAGRLMPSEPQCHFRREMRKRTPVDGFARDDIFYIHPDGRTTEQCFHEVKYQLSECAPIWFRAQNDLENLLSRIRSAEEFASASDLDTYARPGSYSWNALRSVLLLVKHQQSPTQHSAGAALDSINQAMGAILDFSTILVDREVEERYAVEMREVREQ